tara:strand:+ start:304 stop:579 length:276 start_codon:yes stop_codon:yes gene_type:complete
MISRTDVIVYTETWLDHTLTRGNCLIYHRSFSPLPVKHAFRRGNNHLRPFVIRIQRSFQRVTHCGDIVCIVDLAYPLGTDSLYRRADRVTR